MHNGGTSTFSNVYITIVTNNEVSEIEVLYKLPTVCSAEPLSRQYLTVYPPFCFSKVYSNITLPFSQDLPSSLYFVGLYLKN